MKSLLQVLAAFLLIAAILFSSFTLVDQPVTDDVANRSPAERGRELATAQGCIACHSQDGSSGIGPGWAGAWGTVHSFTDGSTALVNEAYLRESILTPDAKIVNGFENLMVAPSLNDQQIADIIAFIRELGSSGGK